MGSSDHSPAGEPAPAPPPEPTVADRLRAARGKLDAGDLPGALAIHEEVLASAGDRADVLVRVSGDLGSTGHVAKVIELVAPHYDAARHGPAAGLNILQAYLAVRDADAAQHVLDLLFALKRPDLEERLHGFSNAIAEILLQGDAAGLPGPAPPGAEGAAKVAIITISRPVWSYGLEPLAPGILPAKEGRLRRIAFTQLGLPGAYADFGAALLQPEDEMGRLSRALPVWFAEAFFYSPLYSPLAAVALMDRPGGPRRPMLFESEWTTEHLRQLADTTGEAIDYAVTGALRSRAGDCELGLRVWDMRKYRERRQFLVRWTPATADAELGRIRDLVCRYMECEPGPSYAPPARTRDWIDALGASLSLFLAEKGILPKEMLPAAESLAAAAGRTAADSPLGALAWISFARRCRAAGIPAVPVPARLFDSPLVRGAGSLEP